jgi:hypothetical protein
MSAARARDTSLVLGVAALAAVAAFHGACSSTVRLYGGPSLPETELAIFHAIEPCRVLSIDGQSVPRMENRFALAPGDHWLSFRVRRRYRDSQASTNCMAYVAMEAGHTYAVRSHLTRTTLDHPGDVLFAAQVDLVVELEDTTTGRRIEDLVCE